MKMLFSLLILCLSSCSEKQTLTELSSKRQEVQESDEKLMVRLQLARVPVFALRDESSLEQALNFLAIQFGSVDPPSDFPEILHRWNAALPVEIQQQRLGELRFRNISPAELLDVFFIRCGYDWTVANGLLVLEKRESDGNKEVLHTLKTIMLEHLEFAQDTTFRQAINFLRLRARELDTSVTDASKRGVSFVYEDRFPKVEKREEPKGKDDDFTDEKAAANKRMGELGAYNISLEEALTIISRRAGLRWHVGEYRVKFSNRDTK